MFDMYDEWYKAIIINNQRLFFKQSLNIHKLKLKMLRSVLVHTGDIAGWRKGINAYRITGPLWTLEFSMM